MENLKKRRVDYFSEWHNRTFAGHIEYEKTCTYCGSLYWAKKKTANYCTNACRNLVRQEKKRSNLS